MRCLPIILLSLIFLSSCNPKKIEHLQTAFNTSASLNSVQGFNPLNGIVINTYVDSKAHTTSTLYGNDIAIAYVRSHDDGNYPKGSVLSLVSWTQEDDARWYGARIPDSVLTVDVLRFNDTPDYKRYVGKDLVAAPNPLSDSISQWMRRQRCIIVP